MTRSIAIRALLGALLLGAGTSTSAQAAPITGFASLIVGGQLHDLTVTADPTKSTRFFVDEVISSDAFDVHVTATLDGGAFILFGINVANFGANPLTVLLSMAVNVLPVVDPTIAFSSIRGTLNAGQQSPTGVTLGVGSVFRPRRRWCRRDTDQRIRRRESGHRRRPRLLDARPVRRLRLGSRRGSHRSAVHHPAVERQLLGHRRRRRRRSAGHHVGAGRPRAWFPRSSSAWASSPSPGDCATVGAAFRLCVRSGSAAQASRSLRNSA